MVDDKVACGAAFVNQGGDHGTRTLWLIGVPIPIIILLWLFFGR